MTRESGEEAERYVLDGIEAQPRQAEPGEKSARDREEYGHVTLDKLRPIRGPPEKWGGLGGTAFRVCARSGKKDVCKIQEQTKRNCSSPGSDAFPIQAMMRRNLIMIMMIVWRCPPPH